MHSRKKYRRRSREKARTHTHAYIPTEDESETSDWVVSADAPTTSRELRVMEPGEDGLINIKVPQDASDKINIVLDATDLEHEKHEIERAVRKAEHYNKAKLKNRFAMVLIDKLTAEVDSLKEEVNFLRDDCRQKSEVIKSLAQKVLEKTETHDKWHFKVVKQVEQGEQYPIPEIIEPPQVSCCNAFAMFLVDSMSPAEVGFI